MAGNPLTIDNQAITQTTGGQVTFAGNVDANSGLDVAGNPLTIDNQAITQTTGGQVTFAGNVDANSGLDVTGNLTITTGNVEIDGDLIINDGGVISQNSSKSNPVTLNKRSGKITMNNATLNSDTTVSFTVNNNTVKTGDVIIVNHISDGTFGDYIVQAGEPVANTSFKISVRNISGNVRTDALVLHFVIITATIS